MLEWSGDTAVAGVDIELPDPVEVTIKAGQVVSNWVTTEFKAYDDALHEGNELFTARCRSVSTGMYGGTARYLLADDDEWTVTNPRAEESDGVIEFEISLGAPVVRGICNRLRDEE